MSRAKAMYELTENEVRYENAALDDENKRLRAALKEVEDYDMLLSETDHEAAYAMKNIARRALEQSTKSDGK